MTLNEYLQSKELTERLKDGYKTIAAERLKNSLGQASLLPTLEQLPQLAQSYLENSHVLAHQQALKPTRFGFGLFKPKPKATLDTDLKRKGPANDNKFKP